MKHLDIIKILFEVLSFIL